MWIAGQVTIYLHLPKEKKKETNMDNEQTVSTAATEDNSSTYSEQDIYSALDEPSTTQEDTQDTEQEESTEEKVETKDNTQIECPDKFKNQDGTPNWENVLKSYKELESNSSRKEAEWKKERADLLAAKQRLDEIDKISEQQAKNAGYNSFADLTDALTIARTEAEEYAKYVQYTDDPQAVLKMLQQYADNPTQELLEDIELEFAPAINKKVALASDKKQRELSTTKAEREETIMYTNIENVISQSVEHDQQIFQYEPFNNLFAKSIERFGDKFTLEDAKALIGAVNELKSEFKKEFEKEYGMKQQNDKAIDKIASINNSSAQSATAYNPDLTGLSDKEVASLISKYI